MQEGLILDVTEQIWERMQSLGLKKQDLADKLDKGKSHVTQLLSGSRNMTLRTLSDIATALDCEVKITIGDGSTMQNPVDWFKKYKSTKAANQATISNIATFDNNIVPLIVKVNENNEELMYG